MAVQTPTSEPNSAVPAEPRVPTILPTSFNDLCANLGGLTALAVVAYLAVQSVEQAQGALYTGLAAWVGWTMRGRIQEAKNGKV